MVLGMWAELTRAERVHQHRTRDGKPNCWVSKVELLATRYMDFGMKRSKINQTSPGIQSLNNNEAGVPLLACTTQAVHQGVTPQ